ncbi:hypothetical protein COV23_00185 [Candidatus Wolfebacteria bacterium CG10_big_fil_rev_8_21_14_0_10_31_9]|uniref:Type 4 fimbrial biogenesis protein PilX N-terminal domain-containing protein n=1 Tax=Candidatus Wolfebacteria bacterium CG10_big_fil_rev_8_21_14_0_10_31_9 TaxID=1975070 RepID=A0A2H0RCX0_9BACT|nr:MAG: hypothetical protein COV23_00185 [Candidatus Wolfebacteria bacterium CG10_big_fil_rev_8_21_14_0_10_31_9]
MKQFNNKTIHNKGQLIVEAVVAISFIVIAVVSFFGLLAQSVGYNRFVSENYTATYLAAEGIEVIKNIIDSNILNARPWNLNIGSGDYEIEYNTTSVATPNYSDRVLRINSDGIYTQDLSGQETPFKRKISIRYNSSRIPLGDEIIVNSIVTWTSRGQNQQVNLEDHFFNWRE